jgi:hypothetical protein
LFGFLGLLGMGCFRRFIIRRSLGLLGGFGGGVVGVVIGFGMEVELEGFDYFYFHSLLVT